MNSAEKPATGEGFSWETWLLECAQKVNRSKANQERETAGDIEKEFRRTLDKLCAGCDRDWIVGHFAMRLMPGFMPTDDWETSLKWTVTKPKRTRKRKSTDQDARKGGDDANAEGPSEPQRAQGYFGVRDLLDPACPRLTYGVPRQPESPSKTPRQLRSKQTIKT